MEKKTFRITRSRVEEAVIMARSESEVEILLGYSPGAIAWRHLPDMDERDIEEVTEDEKD